MTREEILALCNKAPDVGSVKHADFADYIVVLESRRKVNDEWQTIEHAYLAVDGKVTMANADHRKQGKRLDFAEPKVLIDNVEQLTLQITVTSEIYGRRHGIATSRRKRGTNAEREFPWEVAETSAIGRALAAIGYGLLPGAGLASAEDVMRSSSAATNPNGNGKGGHPSTHPAAQRAAVAGAFFCTVHQTSLQQHAKGWAHQLKSGSWCFGRNNGAAVQPVVVPSNGGAPRTSAS